MSSIVEWYLIDKNYRDLVDEVYAYKTFIDDGYLYFEERKNISKCNICESTLCKLKEIEKHVLSKSNTSYIQKICVGYGKNDICACRALNADEFCFVRKNFTLHELISKNTYYKSMIKGNIMYWDDGLDLTENLKRILNPDIY